MAATPKKPQQMKFDFGIDREIYDDFVRICARTKYAPKVVIQRMMQKFNENDGRII